MDVVRVVALLGTGAVVGVFYAVAISVAPALFAMPPGQYLQTQQMLGKGYHPTMPLLVNATVLSEIALAVLAPGWGTRSLFLLAIVALVGVQAVSHLGNVPINRTLKNYDLTVVDTVFDDPRPRWLGWHRLRTVLATAAFLLTAFAVTTA